LGDGGGEKKAHVRAGRGGAGKKRQHGRKELKRGEPKGDARGTRRGKIREGLGAPSKKRRTRREKRGEKVKAEGRATRAVGSPTKQKGSIKIRGNLTVEETSKSQQGMTDSTV